METKNIEKEFNIEVIASLIENRLLASEDDIYELCSFITNENVNMYSFHNFVYIVRMLILEQYPELNNRINYEMSNEIEKHTIESLKTIYKNKFGDKLKIKSLKKEIVKTLKLQDK